MKKKEFYREFKSREFREAFTVAHVADTLPLQIRALRLHRRLSQKEFANRFGMKQSQVSRLERLGLSNLSLATLYRLARAFDVAVTVRFESFGYLANEAWTANEENLVVPSFDEDPAFKGLDYFEGPALDGTGLTNTDWKFTNQTVLLQANTCSEVDYA